MINASPPEPGGHWPGLGGTTSAKGEPLRTAGKIRWYGISTNNREAVDQLRAYGPLHVLQIGYNLLERQADALLRWAHSENIGTLMRYKATFV